MRLKVIATATLLLFGLSAVAETPNIEPGMWEYHNKMTFQSDVPIPDQEHTNQECVTLEDIERGDAFLEDVEECDITNQEIRSDGMDYSMSCHGPDGTEMTMDASMQFYGDRTTGTIHGEMDTPMGPMQMTIELTGERIGDC
ncbi:DUF3617 family protein [Wenzhouxiangella sp. AB-CW3]|uniref:DUF3617 domain-containing protein n=1 Tax=Wenzhouxiangella sp. AB-CW3 TaxID=2771012 RepID=UPI00168B6B74|nr:DUF3617 family protein [Wenzhouxiangella sp. AB-CW3]QOC22514.1 DUF3617 family protein [Wenzhouxiangella sp. AB-CW3]